MNRPTRHTRRDAVIAAAIVATPFLVLALDFTLHGHAQATPTYRACEWEDSDGPCRWDAESQGNGLGRSFVREADGTVTYLD